MVRIAGQVLKALKTCRRCGIIGTPQWIRDYGSRTACRRAVRACAAHWRPAALGPAGERTGCRPPAHTTPPIDGRAAGGSHHQRRHGRGHAGARRGAGGTHSSRRRRGASHWDYRTLYSSINPQHAHERSRPMSLRQKLLTAIVPRRWADEMEAESRSWMLHCNVCGLERSV